MMLMDELQTIDAPFDKDDAMAFITGFGIGAAIVLGFAAVC